MKKNQKTNCKECKICSVSFDGTHRASGRMIVRNDFNAGPQTNATIKQFSYLGKIDEQDVTPKGVKKFFSSQFYKDYEKSMEKRKYWSERRKQENV